MVKVLNILGTNYKRVEDDRGVFFLDTSYEEDKETFEKIISDTPPEELSYSSISRTDDGYDDYKNEADKFFGQGVSPEDIINSDNEDDYVAPAEEDYDESEKRKRKIEKKIRKQNRAISSKGIKIIASVAALAALAGVGYAVTRKQNKMSDKAKASATKKSDMLTTTELLQNEYKNKGMADAINLAFSNNETAKEFYTTLYETLNGLNLRASQDSFVLGADKDSNTAMRFTYKEVMSAMLALNNYSDEELYKIFGNTELNKEELVENYENFVNKMIIYSMNAQAPSGVDRLIKDEGNKTLVKLFDSAISTFNKNSNSDNADRIIRYFDYYIVQSKNEFVYDKDISSINSMSSADFESYKASSNDKKKLDDKTSDFARHLVINMVQGYMNANSQGDYKAYRVVSSEPGNFDKLFTTDSLAQVQKGQNMEDYYAKENDKDLSIIETTGCTTEKVTKHLEGLVDSLTGIQKTQNARLIALSGELVDAKKSDLADLVIDGLTDAEKEQIANDKKGKDIIAKYSDVITVDNEAINFFLGEAFEQFEKKTFAYGDVNEKTKYNDFAELFNNRVRGYTKVAIDAKTNGSVTDSKGSSRTATNTQTKTEYKEVSKSDLTESERRQAEIQEEEIIDNSYQVSIGGKTYNEGEASRAVKQGWEDATSYATMETGSYKHEQIVNKINPDSPTVVPVDETLFDIATNMYAFNGTQITSSDSQIQARLASDIAKFGNSEYKDAYREGWLEGIEQVLSAAVSKGAMVRSEAEELYRQAKEKVQEKNNESENSETNTTTGENQGLTENTSVENEVPEVIDNMEVENVDSTNTEIVDNSSETETVDNSSENEETEIIDDLDVYDVDSDDIMNPSIVDSIDGIDISDEYVDGYNVEDYMESYYALSDEEFAEQLDSEEKVLSKSL